MTQTADPRHLILTELFRTLDDAILSERGAGSERGMDRLLTYSDLYHATCYDPDHCRRQSTRCISPYRELLRLTRRPGPLHAHSNELRWHVMQRHRWLDRRPMLIRYRNGRPIATVKFRIGKDMEVTPLAAHQAILGEDRAAKTIKATRSLDHALAIVETWSPRVDPTAVTLALDWLADHYTVPLQLPRELREAVAA